MLIKLTQLMFEVKSASLIIILTKEVLFISHLAVITAVELKHISQWFLSLHIDLVKFLDESKSSLEISLECKHLLLILKADHGHLCGEVHVLECLIIGDREVCEGSIEVVKGDARHLGDIIRFIMTCWH